MSATKKPSGGNLLLWVGLAMVVSSLVLALVGSVYVGRAGGYPGPGGMMGPGGLPQGWTAVASQEPEEAGHTLAEVAAGTFK